MKKRIPFTFFSLGVLASLLLWAMGATVTSAWDWPTDELPIKEGYRDGVVQENNSPEDGITHSDGRQSLYIVRVMPGKSYRLGLRLRSEGAQKLSVTLFDRWPYAGDALPMHLSTSGGLRGMEGQQEFQWSLSVDKESVGSLLYVKITVEPGFNSETFDWRYRLFVVDSPRSPMNSMGSGIIYHRGPTKLKLMETEPPVAFRYQAFPMVNPIKNVSNGSGWSDGILGWHSNSNLIRNGDFSHGLTGWQLKPADAEGIGVFYEKLRIWSHDSAKASGIIQQINVEVSKDDSLKLSLDFKIMVQTESFHSGGASPLILSICYEDSQHGVHCGANAFLKHFVVDQDMKHAVRGVVIARPNTWSRYTFDLKGLNPQPRRLISVELSGSGAPEREVWIDKITL